MNKMLSILVVLMGTLQANAATLRTNMGGSLEESIKISITHTNVSNGRLEVLASEKKDRSKSWKCIISSEVAGQVGYQLGQLQTILMSQEDVRLVCAQPKDSFEATGIIVAWDAKNSF